MNDAQLERFMEKVMPEPNTGCWIWSTAVTEKGYGKFSLDGRDCRAHRVSYEFHVGPIPEGLPLDHLCRVPSCVNPAHLEPVTHRENTLRGVGVAAMRSRQTHCKRGHEFTPENTHIGKKGDRVCRACHNIRNRKWRVAAVPTKKPGDEA